MATPVVSIYEGLFLISSTAANDMNAAIDHVKQILLRGEAEIIVLTRWDERKLAYPIKGQRRGTYIIAFFKCDRSKLAHIERDSNLSEQILRSLVTRADHLGETELDMINKGTFDFAPKKPEPPKDDLGIVVPELEEAAG